MVTLIPITPTEQRAFDNIASEVHALHIEYERIQFDAHEGSKSVVLV